MWVAQPFPYRQTRSRVGFGQSLAHAGYDANDGSSSPLFYKSDWTLSLSQAIAGTSNRVRHNPAYYNYFRRLHYPEFDDEDNSIGEEFELALSLLTRRPFSIAGIEVDRIGIAVSTGEGITGYRLFTSLPF
jgi:hypothetical protein